MKKLIALLTFIVLMTTMAFAQVESVSKLYDTGEFEAYLGCVLYEDTNTIYCFGGDDTGGNIFSYDLDTNTLTAETETIPTQMNYAYHEVFYYGGLIYILNSAGNKIYSYNPATDTITDITPLNYPTDDSTGMCCQLKEGTDEIYCAGAGTYTDGTIFKYDIGDATLTELQTSMVVPTTYQGCALAGNVFYQFGGYYYGGVSLYLDNVSSYNIFTDTQSVLSPMPVDTLPFCDGINCNWQDGSCEYRQEDNRIYCYAGNDGDDYSNQYDLIFVYDIGTDAWSIEPTLLYQEISGSGCIAGYNSTTTLCFGGWEGINWDYSDDVFAINYYFAPEIPPEELNGGLTPYEPSHGITDVTGLVIDFGVEYGVQMIAMVGLIAVVGLGVWAYGMYRKGGF